VPVGEVRGEVEGQGAWAAADVEELDGLRGVKVRQEVGGGVGDGAPRVGGEDGGGVAEGVC